MRKRLDELASDRSDAMQTHPIHNEGMGTVVRLINQLRTAESEAELYDLQQDLLTELLAVEERRAGCSRVIKRFRSGKGVPANAVEIRGPGDPRDVETWEIERDVCERVGRQLRAVGDALAWHVFDFQRNFIIVLSRNEPPGPIAGKTGLAAEREAIHDIWRNDGHFAILHDLTSCLRIGDITIFEPGQVVVREIKTNERRRTRAQEQRILDACEALRSHTPMPGGAGQVLVEIDLPYQTHLDSLRDALDLARQRKLQAMKIPGGRALVAANLFAGTPADTGDESARLFASALENVKRRARIANNDQITMKSVDQVGRTAAIPPWSIYPLPAEMCASLIADVAFFYISMSGHHVIEALDRYGVTAEWLQALDRPVNYHEPLLRVAWLDRLRRRGTQTTMNPSELNRLLLEFADLDMWAHSIAIMLTRSVLGGVAPWPYFTNEHTAWA
jgi:hypothetical protein